MHESRTAVHALSSAAAATLRQSIMMFVIDNVEEEDRPMLLTNEPESIPLPDEMTQALRRNAFSIFEVLCLLDNGERTQFLQLENLHKATTVELVERPRILTNYHQPFRKVRLTSPLPTRDLYTSNCIQITLFHSILSSYSNYDTTSSTCSSKRSPDAPQPPLFRLPSAAPVLPSPRSSNSPPSSRRRPKSSLHRSSNSLLGRLTPFGLGLGGCACDRGHVQVRFPSIPHHFWPIGSLATTRCYTVCV